MVKQAEPSLDRVFAALADPTRRRVIDALTTGSRSVGELAESHEMSLPGFMKHLAVLETAGLIRRSKAGRVVRCELAPAAMRDAAGWLARHEAFWNDRLDALGRYLYHEEEIRPCPSSPPSMPRECPPSDSSEVSPLPSTGSGGPGPTPRR